MPLQGEQTNCGGILCKEFHRNFFLFLAQLADNPDEFRLQAARVLRTCSTSAGKNFLNREFRCLEYRFCSAQMVR